MHELKEKDADVIDKLFKMSEDARYMRVDRTKLKYSCEAWVHVVFEPTLPTLYEQEEDDPYLPPYIFHGFSSKSGTLTWDNSKGRWPNWKGDWKLPFPT